MKKALVRAAIILILMGLVGVSMATASVDVSKVAIIPFKVNADRDLTFLQDGIVDMLSTRLSRPGAVEIIDRTAVSSVLVTMPVGMNEQTARELGAQLGARYVLFGNLTSIGKAISLDARVVDVLGVKSTESYFVQADTMGEVIPNINQLAGTINQQVFGYATQAVTDKSGSPPPTVSPRSHPEKLLGEKPQATPSSLQPVAPLTTDSPQGAKAESPFVEPINPQAGSFWRSRTYNHRIHGISMGDVDGDGRTETVVITDHQAHIYRFEGKQLVKVGETKKRCSRNYIGIDIGDINGNGHPEIFITALNQHKDKVSSRVLEFDGQAYHLILKDSPWYYRVSKSPGMAPILLGQKPSNEEPFKSAVYELNWDGAAYKPGDRVVPKRSANALGCTVGNLRNDQLRTIAAFSESDAIQIFDTRGELLVTEDDDFGGSLLTVTFPVTDPGTPPPIQYLPLRLIISDLNNDGKNELVTVRSKELTGKHLSRLRMFTKGQFVGLTWDGIGLAETWQTRAISGRVADFAVGDLNGDGIRDLVAVLVSKEGRVVGMKPKVNIIAYPLAPKK